MGRPTPASRRAFGPVARISTALSSILVKNRSRRGRGLCAQEPTWGVEEKAGADAKSSTGPSAKEGQTILIWIRLDADVDFPAAPLVSLGLVCEVKCYANKATKREQKQPWY